MKTQLFLFLILLLSFSVNGDPKIDSLHQELKQLPVGSDAHVSLLNAIAGFYWINNPDSSIHYARKALNLARENKDTLRMAESHRMLGVSLWVKGEHNEALELLFKSRAGYEHEKDTLGYANVVMNIALIYRDQQDYKRAFPDFFLSYGIFRRLNEQDRLVNTANHLGICYLKTGDYSQAEKYFLEALDISKEIDYAYGESTAYYNLGELVALDSAWTEASMFLNKALDIQYRRNDFEGAARTNLRLGIVHLGNNELSKAKDHLANAEALAKRIGSKMILCETYRTMTTILEYQGNPGLALDYFKKHHKLQDSLFSVRKTQDIARLENRFEKERNDQAAVIATQRISMLERENTFQQRWMYFLASGLILSIIFASLYLHIWRRYSDRKRKLAENRKKLADVQLENARLQEIRIKEELEIKEKKLASYSLNFIQKGEVLEDVQNSLRELEKDGDMKVNKKVSQIRKQLNSTFHIDRSWDNFRMTFENIHSGFFSAVINYCPQITQNELKLCALIKLQLNLKESAAILGISPESVKTARYRLRKKLELEEGLSLQQFMERMNEKSRAA